MYKTDFVTFHHMPMLGHIQARSKHGPKDIVWVWEVYSQTVFEHILPPPPLPSPNLLSIMYPPLASILLMLSILSLKGGAVERAAAALQSSMQDVCKWPHERPQCQGAYFGLLWSLCEG